MKKLILYVVSLVFLFAHPLKAMDDKEQLLLIGPEFPPHYYYNNQNIPDGDMVQIFSKIVKRAGYDWSGSIVPAKRMTALLIDGNYNASLLVKIPKLEQSGAIIRSSKPVSQTLLNVYFRQGMPAIDNKEDLRGKSLIVMRGYGYGGLRSWLDDPVNKIGLQVVDKFHNAIVMLERGRADYALLYDVNFSTGQEKLGRDAMNLTYSNLKKVPLYLQLNKKSLSNAPIIMDKLVKAYDELVVEGQLEKIDIVN